MDRPWYAFYDKDVPRTIAYPNVTLKELFNKNAENNPGKPYLVFKDITLPYRLCNSMARRLANGLLKRGVIKGDRVALLMPNIPQYPLSLMACYKIGAIAVPANPLFTVPELAFQLSDSGAETVVVMAPFADKVIQTVKTGGASVKRIIVVQTPGGNIDLEEADYIVDYDTLLGQSEEHEPDIAVHPEDVAILQYTGGTTGFPKGCMLTHANLVAMLEQTGAWCRPGCPLDLVRTLAAVPLYHVFGMNCNINMALYSAGTIILVAQPTPDNILEAINRHEPTVWAAVPAMILGMINHPDIVSSKLKGIKLVICGGAPLHVEVMKKFEELSGALIWEGYGLSETSNVITGNSPILRKPGSGGVPFPDVDIRIVDLENGTKAMPTGEPGEIIAKGPQIMSGYWNNQEETANALKDGWLFTGDIGYMDRDGYLFILDRKKDMIICSGFNVYPREIDEILYTNPKILEACAIGIPDEKRGETVKTYVVLKAGMSMTSQEVIDFCHERLVPYKVPKIVEFIDQLPRTRFGKPDRKTLRAMDEAKRRQM
ncbi:MAG: long-chain fatty acid--CoA ligase [Desulfuromonadales bacterium]|nr:long-chain fatty acid--CoA ligase [Desulfuromonadales bacterium]